MPKQVRNFYSPYNADSLKNFLAEESLTLATCWKLTPRTATLTQAGTNVALQYNGGSVVASSQMPDPRYLPFHVINGNRSGSSENYWNDNTPNSFPDWVEVHFSGQKKIVEIDVFSVQDNFTSPIEPTPTMTFSLYGNVNFLVQYWTGSDWQTVPNGNIVGNNLVWRKITFPEITTDRIRVYVTQTGDNLWTRIAEIEAYTASSVITGTAGSIGATSHTNDLVLQGHPNVIFQSTQGVIPSATDSEAGLGSAGLEVDALFKSEFITEESVASGDWDNAFFEVFIINYKAPEMGEMVMFAGFIGDVRTYGTRFRAEGRPLTAKATQQIGGLFTPKCTARNLGDSQCKVNLNGVAADGGAITVNGTVTVGGSNVEFTDTSKGQAADYFTFGIVKFTSGILEGRTSEVKKFASGKFELSSAMPRLIEAGTTYTAIRGCNRLPETCQNVYNNIVNIRAFPKVPGLEKSHRVKPEIH